MRILIEFAKLEDQKNFNSNFFIPTDSLESISAVSGLAEKFWENIELEKLSSIWKLRILLSLPKKKIQSIHLERIYQVINNLNVDFYLNYEGLNNYTHLDTEILINVLKIVTEKIRKSKIENSIL